MGLEPVEHPAGLRARKHRGVRDRCGDADSVPFVTPLNTSMPVWRAARSARLARFAGRGCAALVGSVLQTLELIRPKVPALSYYFASPLISMPSTSWPTNSKQSD